MITKDMLSELNDRQENLFIWIFNECVNNFKVTASNREISQKLNIPESTLEKYLKKLNDLELIERTNDRAYNHNIFTWETVAREIRLSSKYFDPFLLAKLREKRIEDALALIETPQATIRMIEKLKEKRGIVTR